MPKDQCAACKKEISGKDLKYLEFLGFSFPLCSLHYNLACMKLGEVVHYILHEMGAEDA